MKTVAAAAAAAVFTALFLYASALPDKTVIVTACSSNHFVPLTRLLLSIRRHEPTLPIILYDLGMTPEQAEWVKGVNGVVYRVFPFRNWPPHVALERESYSWKPIIISQVMKKDEANVVWMDAGNQLRAPIYDAIHKYWADYRGFYSSTSSGDLKLWTFPATLKALNVPDTLLTNPNCNAAFLGFSVEVYESLVAPWVKCALDANCIVPEGSSRDNHRQDQAVLSCIVALSAGKYVCDDHPGMASSYIIHTEYNDGSRLDLQFNFGIPTNENTLMQFMIGNEPDVELYEEHYIAVLFCLAVSQLETSTIRVLIATDHMATLFVRLVASCLGPSSSLAHLSFGKNVPTRNTFKSILQPNGIQRWNGGDFAHLVDGPAIVLQPTAVFFDMLYEEVQIKTHIHFLERQGFFTLQTKRIVCWPVYPNWRHHALSAVKKQFPVGWSFHFSPILVVESMYVLTAYSWNKP